MTAYNEKIRVYKHDFAKKKGFRVTYKINYNIKEDLQ